MSNGLRPTVNLHQLEVFRAVARRLNFSQAAEELYISQPAVSKQVKELERTLGVSLFLREGRRVHLTDAGRLVYDYAGRAFALVEEMGRALAELQGPDRGYLRLAATAVPGIYLLPRVMAAFQERYPAVELYLEVSNGAAVTRQVLEQQVDLGFVESEVIPEHVHWQPLTSAPIVLVASPTHPLSSSEEMEPAELHREKIVVSERGSATGEMVERELGMLGVKPARTLAINDIEAIKQAAAAGLGLAFLPKVCVKAELRRGTLKQLTVRGLSLQTQIGFISAKGRRLSSSALAFVALLRKTG
ncbi:MAG: LysR substrate-binding domain-containing protein [Chloroflexota bacterium]|nr:LysR substrate-binding domain-containing protein [Chloroflexota bacterium]